MNISRIMFFVNVVNDVKANMIIYFNFKIIEILI